jgi:hypothetical protein
MYPPGHKGLCLITPLGTGVDGSVVMASCATQICVSNGFHSSQGGPVTVLPGRVEELEGLPVDKVTCTPTPCRSIR